MIINSNNNDENDSDNNLSARTINTDNIIS